MNRRKNLWGVDMFHRNIGKSQNYFDELFHNLERERKKMEEIPEERKENRGKRLIDDLLTGYGLGLMLKQHEGKNRR